MSEKDLTVLLTLKDRVAFTFRWLTYANEINFPFKVLIADGGSDNAISAALASASAFPNVNYEYVRYPYDRTPTQYYAKVVDSLRRVQTPFVVFADNDDFFVVDGLFRSIDFLRAHSDFSSARGLIGGVKLYPNSEYAELNNLYSSRVSFITEIYPPGSNIAPSAKQRMKSYFSSYRANWYDVTRTSQARVHFEILRSLNIQDLILSQHVTMLLGVIEGNVQIDSYPYLIRQMEGPGSIDRTEALEKGDYFDRMLLESWSREFTGFLDAVAGAIAEKDGSPIEDARRDVKLAYRKFMAPSIINSLWPELVPSPSVQAARKAISILGPTGRGLEKIYRFGQKLMNDRRTGPQYFDGSRIPPSETGLRIIYDFLTKRNPLNR